MKQNHCRNEHRVHYKASHLALIAFFIVILGLLVSQYGSLGAFWQDPRSGGGLFGRMRDSIQKVLDASFDAASNDNLAIATIAGVTPDQVDIVMGEVYSVAQRTLDDYIKKQIDKASGYSGRSYRVKHEPKPKGDKVYAD
jgi:hypothetical protein